MEVVIELLKPDRRKSEKKSALFLIIFVGMSVSWLALVESKLKISFTISSLSTCEKEKREDCFDFPYFDYAWAIAIFYNGFNNWIVDVIWNRVAVSIFCNFEVTYNIGKEGIQNLCCINITFNDFILFN